MHRTPTTRSTRRFLTAGALILLTACGDDGAGDDVAASTAVTTATAATSSPAAATTIAADLADFCATAAELNNADGPPSMDLLRQYGELAPPDIAEPTAVVLGAFEASGGDFQAVFGDPDVVAAIEQLTAFEAEACGFAPPADPTLNEIDPEATRVDVVATDYAFDMVMPTDAGRYSFVMTNEGAEPHLLILAQLEPDVAVEEVLAGGGESGVIASYESNVATPGTEAVVTVDLAPGRWVMVCPIPNAEGESHAALGMVHEFTVS